MQDDKAIQPLAPLTHSIKEDDEATQNQPEAPMMYSMKEARRQCGDVSKNFFWNLEAEGLIRLARLGRRTFVPRSELKRLIRDGQKAA